MKNGILMDVKNGKATLLTKDGCFISVKVPRGQHPVVGMEYDIASFSKNRARRFILPSLSLSIGALLIFVIFSGIIPLGRNDNTVAAYVSFDVNPSLEAGVNHNLQVVDVKAYNSEGREVVKAMKYHEKISLSQFASKLLNTYERKGYLVNYSDVMIGTTIVGKKKDKLSASLAETVSSIKRNAALYNEKAEIVVKAVDSGNRKAAEKKGISAAKYMMYLEAKRKNKNITVQKAKTMSYSELKQQISPKQPVKPVKVNKKEKNSEKVLKRERNLQPVEIKANGTDQRSSPQDKAYSVKNEKQPKKVENNRSYKAQNRGSMREERPEARRGKFKTQKINEKTQNHRKNDQKTNHSWKKGPDHMVKTVPGNRNNHHQNKGHQKWGSNQHNKNEHNPPKHGGMQQKRENNHKMNKNKGHYRKAG